MAAVQQRPLAREACCDMMESVLRKCASAADLAASDRPTPGTGRSVLNSTTGEASPSKPVRARAARPALQCIVERRRPRARAAAARLGLSRLAAALMQETASPVEPVRRAAKRGRGGADCGEPGGRRKQARQAKPTLQRVLEEWAARLDSDQVTGQSTVEVALQLFRAFLLAPLGEQSAESRTESLMGGFSASRRAQLAGCLWLACKLGVRRPPATRRCLTCNFGFCLSQSCARRERRRDAGKYPLPSDTHLSRCCHRKRRP
jgi:hypothetical protein